MPYQPIAKLNGLPIFGNRITKNNIHINDIITCEVNDLRIYCIVKNITDTMIKVSDLHTEIRENDILFYINDKINTIHNGYLSFSRNINKINNVIYI